MPKPQIKNIIRDVIESATQAEYDFVGDQRNFHLHRLKRAMVGLMELFPRDAVAAMETAVDAWGDKLVKDE